MRLRKIKYKENYVKTLGKKKQNKRMGLNEM